ncbi:MAG: glycosyl hydrolase [Prevotellaceae bacterium]|jgi:hypothetical protein|nr:glycosyl hydrolase [Prevotellaceae bacterium]
MKKYLLIIICLSLSIAGCKKSGLSVLEENFTNPPAASRPGVYWYFMDGNLSAEGVTKDLEAMKQAGIGYVLFLEVNIGIPRGKVDFLSDEWQDLFGHAVRECERLDIRMLLGIGPGWTGSGGPWVKPEASMQHLVYSSVEVSDAGHKTIALPVPAPKTPFFGEGAFTPEAKQQWQDFYEDVAVLAFPSGATKFDTESISGNAYLRIPEIEERTLYYRKPYSSEKGVPQYISLTDHYVPQHGDTAINRQDIKDLTALLRPDGTLEWDAPTGKWTVMRFGRRNNGAATRPAPLPGVGFEADKFDTVAMQAHLDNFTEKLFKHVGFTHANPNSGGLQMLHMDSWEMGAQNWTKNFREEFTRRRGYDPQPFYPVYAGLLVQNREVSERFMWDLRQTAQELVVEFHAGFVRRYANKYGLTLSIQPYDLNPTSDLELAVAADIPAAEFWSQGEWFRGAFNTSWSAAEASSAAHLIGQPVVPAESFTSAFDAWRQHPATVKNQGDWAFASGINRLMYHTFQHQPLTDNMRPGMTMGIYGVHWDRNQTWWYLSDAYHRYVARCQYLLQQGRTVADVLYLVPESAPHVFRAPDSAYDGSVELPDRKGYSFDASPPSLLYQASVQDGCIVFPSGARYKLLALPYWETMTPALLKKITGLVFDGATVIGLPPVKSPSLSNYPACDNEVLALSKELWGVETAESTKEIVTKPYGKGKIIFGELLKTEADNLYPPYHITAGILDKTMSPDFETTGQIRYTHRTTDDCEIYFVANRDDAVQQAEVTFRVSGLQPELWNPNTGERCPLPEFAEKNGRIAIPLLFEPYQSYFIVFRDGKPAATKEKKNFPHYKSLMALEKPWEVSFDPKWGGPAKTVFEQLSDWSLNDDPGIRYYSGTAFYKQSFELPDAKKKQLYLDLGKVKNIARVVLNGKDIGTVWTSPWRVDISSAVKTGQNELSIEVVNLWANRLIGDKQLPDDGSVKPFTHTTYDHYRKESSLFESGLIGPVVIGEKTWE